MLLKNLTMARICWYFLCCVLSVFNNFVGGQLPHINMDPADTQAELRLRLAKLPPIQNQFHFRAEDTPVTEESSKFCVCSKIYDPVCGSNQHSYYNPCQFFCEVGKNDTIYILHQGNCIPF